MYIYIIIRGGTKGMPFVINRCRGKENNMAKRKFHIPGKPLPSAKKIATRGLYEIMWGGKKRNYGKKAKTGKY